MHIDRLRLHNHTVPVDEIVSAVSQKLSPSTTLILCLDSCRTHGCLPENSVWRKPCTIEKGADTGDRKKEDPEVVIWYSTAHGCPAADGEGNNSPFSSALINCLKGDLTNKTMNELFESIRSQCEHLGVEQRPVQYGTFPTKLTLLPPVVTLDPVPAEVSKPHTF